MYCPHCGNQHIDKARFCAHCGAQAEAATKPQTQPPSAPTSVPLSPPTSVEAEIIASESSARNGGVYRTPTSPPPLGSQQVQAVVNVPSHMVGAILSTLFCCMPAGIIAIVYAATANKRLAAGDVEGARNASNIAGNAVIASVVLGIVALVIFLASL